MKNINNLPGFMADNCVTVIHSLTNTFGHANVNQDKIKSNITPQFSYKGFNQIGGSHGGLQNNGTIVCTPWVCKPLRVCILTPQGQICWDQGETCTRTCGYA